MSMLFAATDESVSQSKALVESVGRVLILACKESTQPLEQALCQEGFQPEVLRQEPQPEYQQFSRSYLALLSHLKAWEIAATAQQPTLIVEADFVPVIGMGQLPLPFPPDHPKAGVAWLYTCAPQVYSISQEGYAEGFSVSTVAYVVTPQAAKALIDLELEIRNDPGPMTYTSWDSTLDGFLRARSLKNYIGFRNYGEHGGFPNLEHYKNGLSKTHRADVLYGKLAFMPPYTAQGRYLELLKARSQARLKGILRLLSGKFLRPRVLQRSRVPLRLMKFAVSRHLSFWL